MRFLVFAVSFLIPVFSYAEPVNLHKAESLPPHTDNKPADPKEIGEVGKVVQPSPPSLPASVNITVGGNLKLAPDMEEAKTPEKKEWSNEFFNVKATDWIIAAFTIVIGVYTCFLYRATNKLARISREQERWSKAIERAYVFAKVERIVNEITSTFEGTTAPMARTLFINHGKTPAIIINMTGAPYLMDIAPQQLAQTPDDDRRLPEGWVIASGGEFGRPIEIGISDQELKTVLEGTLKLYCAGMIKYKDILGHERKTSYCWEFIPRQNRFQFCKDSHLNEYT
ncbi:MAG: hypothetical protein HZB34_12830 [Nitrospirae bacterium]|nr:hypothetical protein [Nitrospirota bacterium]